MVEINKMDPEIKAEWLAALRGGEYSQTKGYLAREELTADGEPSGEVGYCCLGVLCDIAEKKGAVSHTKSENFGTYRAREYGQTDEMTMLPEAVAQWAGLTFTWTDQNGSEHTDANTSGARVGDKPKLWELNDDYGYSFRVIADIIEAEF